MPYSVVITMPYCNDIRIPYRNDIRIGIIIYTPYTMFFIILLSPLSPLGVKSLIYRVLSGDRKGDRRVTEVTVNAENH